jgi:dihydroorotase
MLTDRRPILLANARRRSFQGFRRPRRCADCRRHHPRLKRGIGAAGVPEGTDIINCAGKIVAPGLIDMRAFVGEPGASHRETFASASQAAAAGGITTIICQPDTSPVIDNSATVDFVLAPCARHCDRQHPPDGGTDKRHARRGNDRDRL